MASGNSNGIKDHNSNDHNDTNDHNKSNDHDDSNNHNDSNDNHEECLFCSISASRDPTSLLHVDEIVVAFNDIKPSATHHILVVPKKHIPSINNLKKDDLETVKKMKEVGLNIISCRLNKSVDELNKAKTYQMGFVSPPFNSINHIHLHILSKPVKTWWPKSLAFSRFIFRDIDDVISKMEK
ncbi:HIT-like domain-containing protein [Rhizophagus diaphanus]|nr:HIT-like domain-containing protein [Rhizophagus diaphanus] [Rhizophagus sp. MUCL 43196]